MYGRFDSLHKRIGRRRFVNRMTERQVDDVDAERSLVGRGERQRADDAARLSVARSVQYPQPDQPDARRDSLEEQRAFLTGTGDRGGDMGAVTVRVRPLHGFRSPVDGEVVKRLDLRMQIRAILNT